MSQAYYKSFIKDNFIVICGVALVYMKGIILMPLIIKSVGVTIYGGFVLLTSILGIAFGISSFGADFKAKRFMPSAKNMAERGSLFYPQFFFNMLCIFILSLLFVLLEKQLKTHLFKNEIIFSIWIVPLYLVLYLLYSQGSDYFRYTSRVHYMTLAGLCFPYLHIGFILFYIYRYGSISINMLVITMALSAILIAIPSFFVIFRETGAKISFYNSKNLISDIKIGFPLILVNIVDFILAGSDRYLIAFYLTVSDVGYYTAGYVLGSLIVLIPKAMGTALPQLLSRAVDRGDESEAQRMLNYALKIFLLLAIPFIFGSMALSKPILTSLANQDVAQNSFLITPIVALGTLFYGLNLIISTVFFVRLKTHAIFKMNLFAALFNLLANFVLIYFFRNIIVAAITTFLSYFIAFLYVRKIVRKSWPVDFQPVTIAKSVAASAFMYGLLFWVSSKAEEVNSVTIVVGGLVLGIVAYFGGLFVLRTFSKKELQFVKSCVCR